MGQQNYNPNPYMPSPQRTQSSFENRNIYPTQNQQNYQNNPYNQNNQNNQNNPHPDIKFREKIQVNMNPFDENELMSKISQFSSEDINYF